LSIRRLTFFALFVLSSCKTQTDSETLSQQNKVSIQVRMMTYNIMWEENGIRAGKLSLPVWRDRRSLVRDIFQEYSPDIIGLQEASPEQQVGLAADNLEYGIVYDLLANNTSPIMYRTSRFSVEDSGTFVLNSVPEEPGTNIGLRKATFARFKETKTGRMFVVFNIHLDHRGNGSTRQISVVRLAERMATESEPILLTGDFNCRENSPTMRFLYGHKALNNNLGVSYNNSVPFLDALKVIHPNFNLIDHVLVDVDMKVVSATYLRTVKRQASDHFPVLAVVAF